MPTPLMLPDGLAPSNLHLRPTVKARFVESDVYDVCKRLAEVSPRLFVVELSESDATHHGAAWMVMEMCADGVARKVKKYYELRPSIIRDVQYMLHLPLHERIRLAEEEIAKNDAGRVEDNLEQMWEEMGHMLWGELDRCNFISERPTSYPKAGRTARRSRAAAR